MARNRIGKPASLGAILQERFSSLGWEKKLREMEIFKRWEEAVGPQIARRSRPACVRNKRLTIVVDSPAWAQQLSLLRSELLRKFDLLLGEGVIDDIYLTSGKLDPPPPREEVLPEEVGEADPALLQAIDEEASRIADGELREAFRRTLLASIRRKKLPR
jgi:hypothetical protein